MARTVAMTPGSTGSSQETEVPSGFIRHPWHALGVIPASFYLWEYRFWSSCWMLANVGGVVFIYHIIGAESRWHDVAGYRRRMQDDVCVQDGEAVWRHGDIDGRSYKVNAMIFLEDGVEEDGCSNFCDVCVGVRGESA
jgi:hypothetical protein